MAFTTSLGLGLHGWLDPGNLIMLYLLGVLLVSLGGRRGPALLTAILSVLSFVFFFMSPSRSLVITDTPYLITFTVMLVVALVLSQLTVASRRQAEAARLREHRTAALHALSRQLASSRGTDTLLQIAIRHIGEVFDSRCWRCCPTLRAGCWCAPAIVPNSQWTPRSKAWRNGYMTWAGWPDWAPRPCRLWTPCMYRCRASGGREGRCGLNQLTPGAADS